jgi:hypothetical protein
MALRSPGVNHKPSPCTLCRAPSDLARTLGNGFLPRGRRIVTDGPPDFSDAKLDFSQFHATGDHWPFTAYCRSQYGGGRVHLAYAWEFHRRDQVLAPWHWFRCRTGHHRMVNMWFAGEERATPRCFYCKR